MAKLSDMDGTVVFAHKSGKGVSSVGTRSIGKIHRAVFSPGGKRLVGFFVSRPDVAGMVRRDDAFVALDSLKPCEGGVLVACDAGMDDSAKARLGIAGKAWDACVLWVGMDVVTEGGRDLGFVGDAAFDEATGAVASFFVGDGGVANSLVGSIEVPADMLRGYHGGRMVVADEAAAGSLTGGLAARAGAAAGRARFEGGKVAANVGKTAEQVADKGSRALGRQLGRTRGMFGAFVDEYRKASR